MRGRDASVKINVEAMIRNIHSAIGTHRRKDLICVIVKVKFYQVKSRGRVILLTRKESIICKVLKNKNPPESWSQHECGKPSTFKAQKVPGAGVASQSTLKLLQDKIPISLLFQLFNPVLPPSHKGDKAILPHSCCEDQIS